MKYGELLASLRKSRKISQEYLARDIASQSSLSRSEIGGKVYAHNLISYLNKLHVHPTEFFMLAEESDFIDQQNFNKKLQSAFLRKTDRDMLIKEERMLYVETGNELNLVNAIRVEAVYAKIHDLPLDEYPNDLDIVKKYLLSIDTWMIFEVTLYLDMLFMFDDQFIEHYHHRMVLALKSLPFGEERRQALRSAYANNMIVLDFERNNMRSLKKHIEYFKSTLSKNPRNLFSSIQVDFYTKMYQLKFKEDRERSLEALNSLRILKSYGYFESYTSLRDFFFQHIPVSEQIKKHY